MPTWWTSFGSKTESAREPLSLADRQSLRSRTKSDILQCMKCLHWPYSCCQTSHGFAIGYGGSDSHGASYNCKEYVPFHIVPSLEAQVKSDIQCIDAVWNNYLLGGNNLIGLTQQGSRNGPWTRIRDGSTPAPKREWHSGFLQNEENDIKLFSFISTQISKNDMDGILSSLFAKIRVL